MAGGGGVQGVGFGWVVGEGRESQFGDVDGVCGGEGVEGLGCGSKGGVVEVEGEGQRGAGEELDGGLRGGGCVGLGARGLRVGRVRGGGGLVRRARRAGVIRRE